MYSGNSKIICCRDSKYMIPVFWHNVEIVKIEYQSYLGSTPNRSHNDPTSIPGRQKNDQQIIKHLSKIIQNRANKLPKIYPQGLLGGVWGVRGAKIDTKIDLNSVQHLNWFLLIDVWSICCGFGGAANKQHRWKNVFLFV